MIPHYSSIAKPLYALAREDGILDWDAPAEVLGLIDPAGSICHLQARKAYDQLYKALHRNPHLHPLQEGKLRVCTDASTHVGAGAVLEVETPEGWRSLEFWSAKWSPEQQS
jgi:hypothetical protein